MNLERHHPVASGRPRSPLYAASGDATGIPRVVIVLPPAVPAWINRLLTLALDTPDLALSTLVCGDLHSPALAYVPADMRALLRYERRRCAAGGGQFRIEPTVGADGARACEPLQLRRMLEHAAPDLVVLCGAPRFACAIAGVARLGCWWLDGNLLDGDVAAAALSTPVLRSAPTTALALELLDPAGDSVELTNSHMATCLTSVAAQSEQAFAKMPALMLRAIRHRANSGTELASMPERAPAVYRLGLPHVTPSTGAGVGALLKTVSERGRLRWNRDRQGGDDQWLVVLRDGALLHPERPDMPLARALRPSAELGALVWADPCMVQDGERFLVFVEEWLPRAPAAHLACIELPAVGPPRRLGTVLKTARHLSFPQVFRRGEEWLMTIESGQDGQVVLYRAQEFPLRWEPLATLLSGWRCVDPVLHFHDDGRWYLFVTVAEASGNTSDDLFVFFSDNLTGPFLPHPGNPVVSDPRGGRSAGQLFRRKGKLVRPAQVCAPRYGSAVAFQEVVQLSPSHYCERPMGKLDASWSTGLDGCHTYSASGIGEAIDVRGELPARMLRLEVAAVAGRRVPPAVPADLRPEKTECPLPGTPSS